MKSRCGWSAPPGRGDAGRLESHDRRRVLVDHRSVLPAQRHTVRIGAIPQTGPGAGAGDLRRVAPVDLAGGACRDRSGPGALASVGTPRRPCVHRRMGLRRCGVVHRAAVVATRAFADCAGGRTPGARAARLDSADGFVPRAAGHSLAARRRRRRCVTRLCGLRPRGTCRDRDARRRGPAVRAALRHLARRAREHAQSVAAPRGVRRHLRGHLCDPGRIAPDLEAPRRRSLAGAVCPGSRARPLHFQHRAAAAVARWRSGSDCGRRVRHGARGDAGPACHGRWPRPCPGAERPGSGLGDALGACRGRLALGGRDRDLGG